VGFVVGALVGFIDGSTVGAAEGGGADGDLDGIAVVVGLRVGRYVGFVCCPGGERGEREGEGEMVRQDFLRMAGRSGHVPWEHVWVASTVGRWAAATVGPTVEPSAVLFSSWDVPSVAAWVAATGAGTVGHWADCSAAG